MTIVQVWVLVFATHVNSGSVVQVTGDFATASDCNAVAESVLKRAKDVGNGHSAQCVQVSKVK